MRSLALLLSAMLLSAACSSSDTLLESAPADPPADVQPPVEDEIVEASNKFVRVGSSTFADRSKQISIQDVVSMPDGPAWMLAGSIEVGRSRSRDAVVSVVSPDEDVPDVLTVLPAKGFTAEALTVKTIDQSNSDQSSSDQTAQHLVGGFIVDKGRTKPVIWSFDDDPANAVLTELPTESPNARAVRFASDGPEPVVIGSETVNGLAKPVVWRKSNSGWVSIPVGESEGAAEKGTAEMSAATTWNNQLVIVGASYDPTRDPTPLVWTEQGGQLEEVATVGLPISGVLNDVAVTGDDSQLVAVGSETVDAISSTLYAVASDTASSWTSSSPTLEAFGRRVTTGFGIQSVIVDGDDRWITVTEPFLQQLHYSSDRGANWTADVDLAGLTGSNMISNGFAANQESDVADGLIVVAGGDVAMQWSGSSFLRLGAQDSVPTQEGDLSAADIIVVDETWYIIGTNTARIEDGFEYSPVLWQSPDGLQWNKASIDHPDESTGVTLFKTSEGTVTAIQGGANFFRDPIYLTSDNGDGSWSNETLDIPAPALRLFPGDAIDGPGDSMLISGSKLIEVDLDGVPTRTKPLFLIVESDGSSQEALLTSSSLDSDFNGSVDCMTGVPGDYMAVLSWANRKVEVASSTSGERWSLTNEDDGLNGFEVTDCLITETERVIVGQDENSQPIIATSPDSDSWDVTKLADHGSVNGVSEIDGQLYLVGWTQSDLGSDGAIWSRTSAGDWEQLTDIGLTSDEFSENVIILDVEEHDGIVVAIGSDQGRAGVWAASAEVFAS